MKKLTRALLAAVAFLCFHTAQSQTSYSELSDKYWHYRDRFKKQFIKIGLGQGESVPASTWRVNWGHSQDQTNSALYWTDATIYLGHYLQVLATEYKLLQQNNLSTSSTLNELYYAVRALNRLDERAEPFLYGESPEINGLLLRDDVPSNFHENFQHEYSHVFESTSPLGYTHSDYAPLVNYNSQGLIGQNLQSNIHNVQSLDQLVDIFTGVYLIYKLVPNVTLQPPGEDAILLHPFITNIIGRIYDRLENDGYKIRHLLNNTPVSRGAVCWYAAPIFKSIAREMLGGYEGYADFIEGTHIVSTEEAEQIAEDYGVHILYPSSIPQIDHNAFAGQWNFLENNNITLSNNGFCFGDGSFVNIFSNLAEVIINDLIANWTEDFPEVEFSECIAGGIMNEDNLHITFQLGLLSRMWSPEYIYSNSMLPENGFYWYPLLYQVMHGEGGYLNSPNENFYLSMLSDAPCEGPWSDPNYQVYGAEGSQAPNGWASQSRLFHPDNAQFGPDERSFRGEYSGLDYMLYHNLTQLVFGTEQTFGIEKTCSCAAQLVDEEFVNYDITSTPAFESYSQMGIGIPDYLSHETHFENCQVDLLNDLVICKPYETSGTDVYFTNGAQLNIGVGVKVTVKSGCSLTIDASSITFTDNEFNSGLSSAVVVEEGGQLNIINGSFINIRTAHEANIYVIGTCNIEGSAIDLEHEAAKLTLMSSDQALINIYNSSYSQSYLGKLLLLSEFNAKILIDNVQWNTTGSYFTARNNGEIQLMNSSLNCVDCELELTDASSLNIEQSAIQLASGLGTFDSGSMFFTSESDLKFTDNTHLLFLNESNLSSRWDFDHSSLFLEGNNSKVALLGGQLHLTSGSLFKPTFENISGFIDIGNQIEHPLIMDAGSQLWLEGSGQEDLILKILNHATLWVEQSIGTITLRNGFVNFGGNGHLWTNTTFNAFNVLFSDEYTENSSADVSVWFKPAHFNQCNLIGSGYKGVQNNTTFLDCEIVRGIGVLQNGGRYIVSSCDFTSSFIQSHLLSNVSRVVNSTFINPFNNGLVAIKDLSQSEIIIETSSINGFNIGIQKRFGKLSSRCNSISNCNSALKVENGLLNISGLSNAGFNNFESNLHNIALSNAVGFDLEKGYNYFGMPTYKNITGTISQSCGKLCETLVIPANGNQWWSDVNDLVTLSTSNSSNCGGACEIILSDAQPAVLVSCPTVKPFPKPRSVTSANVLIAAESSRDFEELYLDNYGTIPLDSALGMAASMMETYDSLANDIDALHLFHEILTSNLVLDSADIRSAAQWGVEHMKTTLENLFVSGEVTAAQNRNAFHPFVQEYVDVLNALTTESTADSLVSSQFYLELNKGHLFRTIRKPEMAKEIFVHLDDCSLDSLEQGAVNYWLAEIENEIELLQALEEEGDPSLVVITDSLDLNDVDFSDQEDYRFGVYIHDPNYVSFVNCSQIVFNREVENGEAALLVYPNPSRGNFYLNTTMEAPLNIEVYNAIGSRVYSTKETFGGTIRVQLPEDLAPGRYLIKVASANQSESTSAIVE